MTDFSIFTDDHLRAAETRLADSFEESASRGLLHNATAEHGQLTEVRAELERRAVASVHKAEAA